MTRVHFTQYRRDAHLAKARRDERIAITLIVICGLIVACVVIFTGLKL